MFVANKFFTNMFVHALMGAARGIAKRPGRASHKLPR